MIDWGLFIGLLVFCGAFFLVFTLVPRYLTAYLEELFVFTEKTPGLKNSGWKDIFINYSHMLKAYFVLGVPIAITLFYASTLGDNNVITSVFKESTAFVTVLIALILLISIRLSVLLKKHDLLIKIPYVRGLDKIIPKVYKSREFLKEQYVGYLFDVLFTAFMSGMMILLFKAIFLKDITFISIPGYHDTFSKMFQGLGEVFIQYIWWILLVPLIPESVLKIFGVYPDFCKT